MALGRDPHSETGLTGMQTLLLLVLRCAVKDTSKESAIEDIKKLPLATQHNLYTTGTYEERLTMNKPQGVSIDQICCYRWPTIPATCGIRNGPTGNRSNPADRRALNINSSGKNSSGFWSSICDDSSKRRTTTLMYNLLVYSLRIVLFTRFCLRSNLRPPC